MPGRYYVLRRQVVYLCESSSWRCPPLGSDGAEHAPASAGLCGLPSEDAFPRQVPPVCGDLHSVYMTAGYRPDNI